jgi:inorganic phosphate transporter, PiT family
MFDLEPIYVALLIFSLAAACAFEFVNGFHDTANAVATVIYTNSLPPWVAVTWSGMMNALGVFLGGISVAMGIVNLLPVDLLLGQDLHTSLSMVFALLLSAIIWNVGTWYFGLPSSSSHTLIGSVLGVGLGYGFLNSTTESVNWHKASEIGLSLLFSPAIGFGVTFLLMKVLRAVVKDSTIFTEPDRSKVPPPLIRFLLIATCTGVSYAHGNNDGQKGVGLIMLILIGIVPSYFAINQEIDFADLKTPLGSIQPIVRNINPELLKPADRKKLLEARTELDDLEKMLQTNVSHKTLTATQKLDMRKDVLLINKNLSSLLKSPETNLSQVQAEQLLGNVGRTKQLTEYAPNWVVLLIAVSLGLGTMVGWKRIVVTIGEKIGKSHLTYAQGASAELVAAGTIGLASAFGLPVSTTQVLSSGIAGSMFASGGAGNINPKTVRNIALAWILTLPVSIFLAFSLYLLFTRF